MSKQKSKYGLGWIYKKTRGVRIQLFILSILVMVNTAILLSIAYFLKTFADIATGSSNDSILFTGLLAMTVIECPRKPFIDNTVVARVASPKLIVDAK